MSKKATPEKIGDESDPRTPARIDLIAWLTADLPNPGKDPIAQEARALVEQVMDNLVNDKSTERFYSHYVKQATYKGRFNDWMASLLKNGQRYAINYWRGVMPEIENMGGTTVAEIMDDLAVSVVDVQMRPAVAAKMSEYFKVIQKKIHAVQTAFRVGQEAARGGIQMSTALTRVANAYTTASAKFQQLQKGLESYKEKAREKRAAEEGSGSESEPEIDEKRPPKLKITARNEFASPTKSALPLFDMDKLEQAGNSEQDALQYIGLMTEIGNPPGIEETKALLEASKRQSMTKHGRHEHAVFVKIAEMIISGHPPSQDEAIAMLGDARILDSEEQAQDTKYSSSSSMSSSSSTSSSSSGVSAAQQNPGLDTNDASFDTTVTAPKTSSPMPPLQAPSPQPTAPKSSTATPRKKTGDYERVIGPGDWARNPIYTKGASSSSSSSSSSASSSSSTYSTPAKQSTARKLDFGTLTPKEKIVIPKPYQDLIDQATVGLGQKNNQSAADIFRAKIYAALEGAAMDRDRYIAAHPEESSRLMELYKKLFNSDSSLETFSSDPNGRLNAIGHILDQIPPELRREIMLHVTNPQIYPNPDDTIGQITKAIHGALRQSSEVERKMFLERNINKLATETFAERPLTANEKKYGTLIARGKKDVLAQRQEEQNKQLIENVSIAIALGTAGAVLGSTAGLELGEGIASAVETETVSALEGADSLLLKSTEITSKLPSGASETLIAQGESGAGDVAKSIGEIVKPGKGGGGGRGGPGGGGGPPRPLDPLGNNNPLGAQNAGRAPTVTGTTAAEDVARGATQSAMNSYGIHKVTTPIKEWWNRINKKKRPREGEPLLPTQVPPQTPTRPGGGYGAIDLDDETDRDVIDGLEQMGTRNLAQELMNTARRRFRNNRKGYLKWLIGTLVAAGATGAIIDYATGKGPRPPRPDAPPHAEPGEPDEPAKPENPGKPEDEKKWKPMDVDASYLTKEDPLLRPEFYEGGAQFVDEINKDAKLREIDMLQWTTFKNYSWEANEQSDNPLYGNVVAEQTTRFSGDLIGEELMGGQEKEAEMEIEEREVPIHSYYLGKQVVPDAQMIMMEQYPLEGQAARRDHDGGMYKRPWQVEREFHPVFIPDWYSIPDSAPIEQFTAADGTQYPDSERLHPGKMSSYWWEGVEGQNQFIFQTLE